MRRYLLPSLLTCCWSVSAHAGAWTMPKGEGLAITQLTHFTSDSYWDIQGDRQSQARYTKWEIQPYAEYGLTDAITLGGTAYLQRPSQSGTENMGLADPEIFLRTRVWKNDRSVVSLQPLIKLPSYFTEADNPVRGGSRSTDVELSVLYGRNVTLVSDRDYTDLRVGYRARNQGLNGQYKIEAALGLMPWENWQLIPAIRYLKASEIDPGTASVQTGDLDYDLLKADLTVAYHLKGGNWLQATYFDHLSGRQTGDGQGISFGYAMRF